MESAGLFFRADMVADGVTDDELRARRRRGELHRLQRGAYLTSTDLTVEARHLLEVEAAVQRLSDDAVVCGVSAALVHGLTTWRLPLGRVHVLRPASSGARRGRLVQVHTAALTDDDVVGVGTTAVTSIVRTVVDVARCVPFEKAVVVIDDALHRHLVTRPELERVLDRTPTARGTPAARRAVAFAHPGAGSPGESRSRVAMHRVGLAPPRSQWPITDSSGRLIATGDFGWPDQRVLGEFDGRMKYGRGLRPGQSPGDAVVAEKLREDEVRDQDIRVVRWIWPELDRFQVVAARLERAGVPWRRR